MKKIYKLFVGGGGDDWISHIVETYWDAYRNLNPDFDCSYFSWTNKLELNPFIRNMPDDAHVTIVGHSYGGDAACFALTTRPINVLITIDPVSYLRVPSTFIRSMTKIWLNVRSEPSWSNFTKDDVIAAIGRRYPRPAAPGTAGAPDYSIIADLTHSDFRGMMRSTANGVSGASLLGGKRVS